MLPDSSLEEREDVVRFKETVIRLEAHNARLNEEVRQVKKWAAGLQIDTELLWAERARLRTALTSILEAEGENQLANLIRINGVARAALANVKEMR